MRHFLFPSPTLPTYPILPSPLHSSIPLPVAIYTLVGLAPDQWPLDLLCSRPTFNWWDTVSLSHPPSAHIISALTGPWFRNYFCLSQLNSSSASSIWPNLGHLHWPNYSNKEGPIISSDIQPKKAVHMPKLNDKNNNMNGQHSMSSIKPTNPREVFSNKNYLTDPSA